MRKLVYAHTLPDLPNNGYVGFINLSSSAEGTLDLELRSHGLPEGQASLRLTDEQAQTLAIAILNHLDDVRVEHAVEVAYQRALTRQLANG